MPRHLFWCAATALLLAAVCDSTAFAQQRRNPDARAAAEAAEARAAAAKARVDEAIAQSVALLLNMQEGETKAEWPYEGVYRVGGTIPIGYRIGGTSIVATSLLYAPGDDTQPARAEAIERALNFVIEGIDHPLMAHEFESTYDVRGWGYAYGLAFLVQAKAAAAIPEPLAERAEKAIAFYLTGLKATEIPQEGGWNYARRAGFQQPGASSPFMTGATLQALFEAKRQGYDVDDAMITRALDALEAGRGASGAYNYAGRVRGDRVDGVPGAVGRMLIAESTLLMAGRSSVANVRAAVDAFIVHWDWLDQRRAQQGTHVPPYGVAPYYFYFAHYYAAQAIELLPQNERAEYRRRLHDLLFKVRQDGGTWNDRVFPRSANYGTACALMAMRMPEVPPPARWQPTRTAAKTEATPAGEAAPKAETAE